MPHRTPDRPGRKQPLKDFILPYSLLFAVLFFCCYFVFLLAHHRSFFRSYDGFDQHYLGFVYLGRWGRSVIRTLLTEHRLVIPLWNPAIGYGADIPTTLAAYIWDPFNWISFFVPSIYGEQAFAVMLTAKYYAAGLAFILFARRRCHSRAAVLCGAVLYTFTATASIGFDQSFFLNPMYIFPLLLLGADLLLDEGRPVLYVCMLAFSLVSYFYFAYMMCIFILLYAVISILTDHRLRCDLRASVSVVMRFFLCSVLAFCLSAVGFLPNLLVMLNAGRLDLPHYLPMLYSRQYYRDLFCGFLTYCNMQYRDCLIGFGAAGFLGTAVVLTAPGRYRRIKAEFVLMTAALCIPYAAHVMNGFSYTANRWVWAYALLISYMAVLALPLLRNLSRRHAAGILVLTGIYGCVAILLFHEKGRPFLTAYALLAAGAACVCIPALFRKKPLTVPAVCMLFTCISVTCGAYFANSDNYGCRLTRMTPTGTAYETALNTGGLPLLRQLDLSDGSRFDRYGVGQMRNATWLYGASGMNFYISMYNDYIDRFHNSLAMNTSASTYSYGGLDRRSEPEALMAVNHFFTSADNPILPAGFAEQEAETVIRSAADGTETTVRSYRSDKYRPPFLTFEHAVAEADWKQLSPIERQQVLLQAVVPAGTGTDAAIEPENAQTTGIGNDSAQAYTEIDDLDVDSSAVDFAILSEENLSVEAGTDGSAAYIVQVSAADGKLTLEPHAAKAETGADAVAADPGAGEYYIYFDDISFENGEREGYAVSVSALSGGTPVQNASDSFRGSTWYNPYYGGKTHWLLNLGIVEEPFDRLQITFQTPGTYTIGDIRVYRRSVESIQNNLDRLDSVAENIVCETNRYSCDISTDEGTWLFLSVPWSEGWTATDNGVSVPVQRADEAFMTVRLGPGEHHVVFRYLTPGLLPGLALSMAAAFVLLILCRRKRIPFNK